VRNCGVPSNGSKNLAIRHFSGVAPFGALPPLETGIARLRAAFEPEKMHGIRVYLIFVRFEVQSEDRSMHRWKRTFLFVAGLAVVALLVLGTLELLRSGPTVAFGVTIMAAVLSMLALANSALGSIAADDRSQFANAFAIARRWDEQPMLSSRDVIRPYQSRPADLTVAAVKDDDVKRALIDYANFFWDMAAAVELNWADPRYLNLRFGETLETHYPAIDVLVRNSHDKGALAAIRSINVLRDRWAKDPFKA